MKKIININLSGRLIPIEDTAYEQLKIYLDSLKRYFSREQGGDEIVSDIESRIAELFQDQLRKGVQCITDMDVQKMISSMGRPEQLADEGAAVPDPEPTRSSVPPIHGGKRLTRNENDKILGGVCSGIAAYFGIDPLVARIIFVVITLAWGSGILIYILLWALVPGNRIPGTQPVRHKRLYRDPDHRVVGGVCSGMSNFLGIDPVIIRILFAAPLLGIIFFSILDHYGATHFFFSFFVGSFPTLILIYIVMWIAVPNAITVTEKLEMRGARVDLQNISNAVKEAAEERRPDPITGSSTASYTAPPAASSEAPKAPYGAPYYPPITARHRSTLGDIIVMMVKILAFIILGFVLVVLCIVLISLAGAFLGVAGASSFVFPYSGIFFSTPLQHDLALPAIYLILGVPVVAIIWFFIRLITGFKSKTRFVGPLLGFLWFAGLICGVIVVISVARDFAMDYHEYDPVTITQPASGKFIVRQAEENFSMGGFGIFGDQIRLMDDSILIQDIRVDIEKSDADTFMVEVEKSAQGSTAGDARSLARGIRYSFIQEDSVLSLDPNLAIPKTDPFRAQTVRFKIFVPVGKRIRVENDFNGVDWNVQGDDDVYGKDLLMTPDGLKDLNNDSTEMDQDTPASPSPAPYRYHHKKPASSTPADSTGPVTGTNSRLSAPRV